MDPKRSLQLSQKPDTWSHPDADQSSQHPPNGFLKHTFGIILPSNLSSSKCSFPQVSPLNPICTSPLPHTCHMPCPSHSWFHHPNNIWWGVQIINFHSNIFYFPKTSSNICPWLEGSPIFMGYLGRYLLAVGVGSPPVCWCCKGPQGLYVWGIVLPRAKLAWGRNSMQWKQHGRRMECQCYGFRMSDMHCWRGAWTASLSEVFDCIFVLVLLS
jgi:hypothetical protein